MKAVLWLLLSTFHPPGPTFCSLFGRRHCMASNAATGVFLNMINLLMIQVSKQHVSNVDDLWNAIDASFTSDKLLQARGFVGNLLQLLRTFSFLHLSQMVQKQRAAARISLINCRLRMHTNNIVSDYESCIRSYAKSPEFALERKQASVVKHSAKSSFLPGFKWALEIAKTREHISFSQLLTILTLAPQWPKTH